MTQKLETNLIDRKSASRLKDRVSHPKRQTARKIMLFTSFMLFPITIFYFSPYLCIMGPIQGFISGCILVFGSLFITSLFAGRLFCSYLCPMGGMQDAMTKINPRRIKRKSFFIKWLIFIPWILCIILLPILFGQPFKGINFFFGIDNDLIGIPGISILSVQGIVIYYIVIVVLLLLGFIVGKRSFCHHVCWVGPFLIIGRKLCAWLRIPSLRLKPNNEKCIDCKRCDRACPMSLPVSTLVQKGNMEDTNCILCGECIDACPKNVIYYVFTTYPRAKVSEIKKVQQTE